MYNLIQRRFCRKSCSKTVRLPTSVFVSNNNRIKSNQHTLVYLQTVHSPQSPEADRQEPRTSTEEAAKDVQHPRGQCSREVQVPPTPTANHNQDEVSEEDAFGNGRMYLSGLPLFSPSPPRFLVVSYFLSSTLTPAHISPCLLVQKS